MMTMKVTKHSKLVVLLTMCAHSIVHVLVSQQWTVLNNPQPSGAFYSPWFGMDPADNLNLIQVSTHQQATHTHYYACILLPPATCTQPVNPWEGFGWSAYTE